MVDLASIIGMFISGWLSAYALRTLKKIALFILGLQALMLLGLQSWGIITIHYDRLIYLITNFGKIGGSFIIEHAIPLGIPYLAGFLIGIQFPKVIIIKSKKYIKTR